MTFQIQNIILIVIALFLYLYAGERLKAWVEDKTRWQPETVNIFANTVWFILVFAVIAVNTVVQGKADLK